MATQISTTRGAKQWGQTQSREAREGKDGAGRLTHWLEKFRTCNTYCRKTSFPFFGATGIFSDLASKEPATSRAMVIPPIIAEAAACGIRWAASLNPTAAPWVMVAALCAMASAESCASVTEPLTALAALAAPPDTCSGWARASRLNRCKVPNPQNPPTPAKRISLGHSLAHHPNHRR